jgi:UDP:flavonoid glycosyltransferase YjiC (YdhE family)
MKFLLHSHFPAGHCYPMQAVAQELVTRGHQVVWLTSADNEARVRAVGAQFVPAETLAALDGPLAKENATGLLDGNYGRLKGRLLAQVEDYRAAIRAASVDTSGESAWSADLLLVDVLPHGAAALYELGEVPVYATLGVIPMYLSSAKAPLPVSGQAPPTTRLGILKNWLRQAINRFILLPLLLRPVLNRQRLALGLRSLPFGQVFESFTYSPFLHIQASSPTLEFRMLPQWPSRKADDTVFVGPLVTQLKTPADHHLPVWWDRVLQHPRVIGITQGTLAMDPTSLIVPSIQALADDPKNLLIVVSPHASDIRVKATARNQPLSDNVLLAEWLPYHVLLPQLRLLITNGGYGSITQALSHGVPLLCAGQTEDKRDTAARVSWAKAGIDLGTDSPSAEQVREAASRILEQDSFRDNAVTLGAELRDLGGAAVACDHLERLAKRGRPDQA